MATLFNTRISDTYEGLIKTIDNAAISASLKELSDGSGNLTGLFLNSAGDFKVTNILEFGTLKDSNNVGILTFITAADGIENFDNDISVPTTAAVKLYVDTKFATTDTLAEILVFGNTTSGTDIEITAGDDIKISDSSKLLFGNGATDFEIYHDGTGSFISDLGTGNLEIASNLLKILSATGENMILAQQDNGVQLYCDNSKKLETTSVGATVTGSLTVTNKILGELDTTVIGTTQAVANNSTLIATTAYADLANLAQINSNSSNINTINTNINTINTTAEFLVNKGQPSGYVPLDAGGKILESYLPASIIGQLNYVGTWDAANDTPTLPNPTTVNGDYYIVNAAGTYLGVSYGIGDWIVSNGIAWQKIDNTESVSTVFGRLGNILANSTDYDAFYPTLTNLPNLVANNAAVAANTLKVGITTQQAADITTNNAKISFDTTSSTRLANTSGTNTGDQNLAEVLSLDNTTNGNDIAISAADNITLTDTSKIIMGADSDLETYHDGIKGHIKNITGALNIESNNIEIGTYNNSATGLRSIAIGANTTASNTDAIAMGENTTATGISSTAIGKATNASADGATSMGNGTTASGVNSTSMGVNTLASGAYSTSTGNNTTASGDNSFSAGANTTASGERSTATGNNTLAGGNSATAIGTNTEARATSSFATGINTLASGNHSTAMGNGTVASGTNSISAGSSTTAGGNQSFAVGFSTTANGNVATAMGNSTVASGVSSTAMGLYSVASGVASTATGYDTEASGANSTAMGKETTASGLNSFATGGSTTASGDYSTASGRSTLSSGSHSFAAGFSTIASGESSTAMGVNSTASGDKSVSIGDNTIANSFSEIAIGRNPVAKTGNATIWVATDRLFSIGNGASASSQSMALEILKNGITVLPAVVSLNFADDTAAATGGVPVGGLYHTSGAIKIRLT
ncbi:MAG: hypothetical protein ACI8ZX_000106 [Planctomycetota bacterium]|jgi:hypothetical protein